MSTDFTLKVIFSGVVCLVPQGDDWEHPQKIWALIPDLTSPKLLPEMKGKGKASFGFSQTPRHEARLFFAPQQLVSAEGHDVLDGVVCDKTGSFKYIRLEDRLWSFAFTDPIHQDLEIAYEPIFPPKPNDPAEAESFRWAIVLNDIARQAGGTTAKIPQDLFQPTYKPMARSPKISARFELETGRLATGSFALDDKKQPLVVEFPFTAGGKPTFSQVVPAEIQLSIQARGQVMLVPKPFDGAVVDEKKPIVLDNKGNAEVVLYVENQPSVPCNLRPFQHAHFGVYFSLFDTVGGFTTFPEPKPKNIGAGPVHNSQCSPAAARI